MAPEGSARQQSGTKNEQVDLAIIGAGIAGLYCALKYNGTKFKTITIYRNLRHARRASLHPLLS